MYETIIHTHTRNAESVKTFVQITRYPFQTLGREIIGEGLRGAGGQRPAHDIGASPPRIMRGLPTRGH